MVELRKPVYIIPYSFVGSVKNMRAVTVHLYAFHFLGINIAGNMLPSVNQAHPPALSTHLAGKNRAVQPCAHDQIIIIHFYSSVALYLSSCA